MKYLKPLVPLALLIDWTATREVMVMPKKRDTPEEIRQHLRVELDAGKGLAVLSEGRDHRTNVGQVTRTNFLRRAVK